MWINLTQLIRNRVADRNGNTLPVDLKTGTYELRDLSPGVGHLHVDGLALDDTFGFSAVPPPCPSCCPLVSIAFDSGFLDLPFGTTDPVGIVGINQCTGGSEALTPDFGTWGSDNVGIAKASYAKVQATGPGSTTVYAGGYVNGPGECECSPVFQQPTLPVTVQPAVTGVNQVYGAAGFVPMRNSTVTNGANYISYTATCNPSNGDFNWTTSSSNVTLQYATGPTVTVYGAKASASLNDTAIQVTCSLNGQTSPPSTAKLTVQQPTTLTKTGTDTTSPEAKCTTSLGRSGCGVNPGRQFTYQVYDQLSPANPIQAPLDFFDYIQTVSGSDGCNLGGSYTTTCPGNNNTSCSLSTADNGSFSEKLSICAPACLSGTSCISQCKNGPTNANQTWTLNGFALTGSVKALAYNCSLHDHEIR